MHTPSTVHVAVGLAALSTVLSAFALFPSRNRSAPREALPAAPDTVPHEMQAVRAELTSLRAEVEALRRSLSIQNQRTALLPVDSGESEEKDGEVGSPGAPTDGPALSQTFSLRERLLERFLSLSGDERADALRELGELARWGDAEARALLVQSLEDADKHVRERAVRELTGLADPALLERLPVLVADRSGDVREAAARALGRIPGESAGPMLVELLGDPKEDVVLEALRSLDKLHYAEAGPRVRPLLAAPDLDVAARAARFLHELGDDGARASVVTRVLEHFARADVSARLQDVKYLRTLRARNELQSILDTDASSSVRFEAQKALASLED